MNREYLRYVEDACKNGLSPQEVQSYFDEISKTNSKKGKEFLKLTSIGVGRAKKKAQTLNSQNSIEQNMQTYPQQSIQEKGYQYQYFKQ